MEELAFLSIEKLLEKLREKEISREELLGYFIKRCKKYDPEIGSTLEIFEEDTISGKTSEDLPLYGIPGLVKDVICQEGKITSCASRILENFISPYDATAVKRLKEAGAVSIGRANCDEFAMGSSTETSAYKKTKNPWDLSRVPGGSSGGSAAAVAAGFVPWTLGTDTGGSVRQPASFCGIVGIKPTYGLIPRHGLVAYASSLDTIGVCTRTVRDNVLVFSLLIGPDNKDSTAIQTIPETDYLKSLTGKIKPGLKIGIIDNTFNVEGIDPGVKKLLEDALKVLEKLGAQISSIKLPSMDHCAAVYFMVSRAEAASNLSRFDGIRYGTRSDQAKTLDEVYEMTRCEGFGHEVKRRILIGNYVLSSGHAEEFYNSARAVQRMIRKEFLDAYDEFDLLFAPASPCPAFKFGAYKDNSFQMDLQDYFTASINLAGIPAIVVPCGFVDEGLPVGFQLIGNDLSEELIFQTAYAYEQTTEWYKKRPGWLN